MFFHGHRFRVSGRPGAFNLHRFSRTIGSSLLLTTLSAQSQVIELSDLDGSAGFAMNGAMASDFSGQSVASGDINGDGIDDLIVGAGGVNAGGTYGAGAVYVYFGSASQPAAVELSDIDGTNGFVITGVEVNDNVGTMVSSADVNGDGTDDVILSATPNDPDSDNVAHVVFGRATPEQSQLSINSLNGGNGFTLNAEDVGDHLRGVVSRAGDVNGDGIEDLLVGANGADPGGRVSAGVSYVIFGNNSFQAVMDLSALNGMDGFAINGVNAYDASGWATDAAGDVNGDGIDDLVIGAPGAANGGGSPAVGNAYVVFGVESTAFPDELELSDLDGSNGFVVNGLAANNQTGQVVSGAGDINGDDVDDLLIGSRRGNAGTVYVVFGDNSAFPASLPVTALDGSNGFLINGINTYDGLGNAVSEAGDINGDGIDDVILGAQAADPNGSSSAGESYVVFGNADIPFPVNFNLASLGNSGLLINGFDPSGFSGGSVSSAGDVNADGAADVVIGALFASPNGNTSAGQSYVVFGTRPEDIFADGFE